MSQRLEFAVTSNSLEVTPDKKIESSNKQAISKKKKAELKDEKRISSLSAEEHYKRAVTYKIQDDLKNALLHFNNALLQWKQLTTPNANIKQNIMRCYAAIGIIKAKMGQKELSSKEIIKQSLEATEYSIVLAREMNLTDILAYYHYLYGHRIEDVGGIYFIQEDYANAAASYGSAIEHYQRIIELTNSTMGYFFVASANIKLFTALGKQNKADLDTIGCILKTLKLGVEKYREFGILELSTDEVENSPVNAQTLMNVIAALKINLEMLYVVFYIDKQYTLVIDITELLMELNKYFPLEEKYIEKVKQYNHRAEFELNKCYEKLVIELEEKMAIDSTDCKITDSQLILLKKTKDSIYQYLQKSKKLGQLNTEIVKIVTPEESEKLIKRAKIIFDLGIAAIKKKDKYEIVVKHFKEAIITLRKITPAENIIKDNLRIYYSFTGTFMMNNLKENKEANIEPLNEIIFFSKNTVEIEVELKINQYTMLNHLISALAHGKLAQSYFFNTEQAITHYDHSIYHSEILIKEYPNEPILYFNCIASYLCKYLFLAEPNDALIDRSINCIKSAIKIYKGKKKNIVIKYEGNETLEISFTFHEQLSKTKYLLKLACEYLLLNKRYDILIDIATIMLDLKKVDDDAGFINKSYEMRAMAYSRKLPVNEENCKLALIDCDNILTLSKNNINEKNRIKDIKKSINLILLELHQKKLEASYAEEKLLAKEKKIEQDKERETKEKEKIINQIQKEAIERAELNSKKVSILELTRNYKATVLINAAIIKLIHEETKKAINEIRSLNKLLSLNKLFLEESAKQFKQTKLSLKYVEERVKTVLNIENLINDATSQTIDHVKSDINHAVNSSFRHIELAEEASKKALQQLEFSTSDIIRYATDQTAKKIESIADCKNQVNVLRSRAQIIISEVKKDVDKLLLTDTLFSSLSLLSGKIVLIDKELSDFLSITQELAKEIQKSEDPFKLVDLLKKYTASDNSANLLREANVSLKKISAIKDSLSEQQRIQKLNLHFLRNIIPITILNELGSIKQINLYGSRLLLIALFYEASRMSHPKLQNIQEMKLTEETDLDVFIDTRHSRIQEWDSYNEKKLSETTEDSLLNSKFKYKYKRSSGDHYNYEAMFDHLKIEATINYNRQKTASHDDLSSFIPLTTIKAHFESKVHDGSKNIILGDNFYLVIDDPNRILEKSLSTGKFTIHRPNPLTSVETCIFARSFGVYFLVEGILEPDENAQVILDINGVWAHEFFARKFFIDASEEEILKHRNACYSELKQISYKKNLSNRPELFGTIQAFCRIVMLSTPYYQKRSDVRAIIKKNGRKIYEFCNKDKEIQQTSTNIARLLQRYMQDKEHRNLLQIKLFYMLSHMLVDLSQPMSSEQEEILYKQLMVDNISSKIDHDFSHSSDKCALEKISSSEKEFRPSPRLQASSTLASSTSERKFIDSLEIDKSQFYSGLFRPATTLPRPKLAKCHYQLLPPDSKTILKHLEAGNILYVYTKENSFQEISKEEIEIIEHSPMLPFSVFLCAPSNNTNICSIKK